jgi:hypothetical protein
MTWNPLLQQSRAHKQSRVLLSRADVWLLHDPQEQRMERPFLAKIENEEGKKVVERTKRYKLNRWDADKVRSSRFNFLSFIIVV